MKLENRIETPRLIIRPYGKSDRDFCLSLWCDKENGRYMADPAIENADEKYLSLIRAMADEKDGLYLIAQFKDSGIPVGTCCAFPEGDICDIGYCVSKDHWREGLGSEMIRALIGLAAANGMTSITAEVADGNAASVALLEKFGFYKTKATKYKKYGEDTVFDAHILRLDLI